MITPAEALRPRWRRGADELDSLLDLDAPLDPEGVAGYLAWGHPTGERSLRLGVQRVPFEIPVLPPDPDPRSLPVDARADRLWELLVQATREPGWCTLSGGLDSRAVAAAARASEPRGLATFGDPDCVDLPVARGVAAALEAREHVVTELPGDAALRCEARVLRATGGLGGAASAPGAWTDDLWDTPRLYSGTSGDVIWGDTARRGPSSPSRLRKLGVHTLPDPLESVATPPAWCSYAGRAVWSELHTRQGRVTWLGALSRFPRTEVVPVPWTPGVLGFCLALEEDDRRDRRLLRRMLARHAPAVSALSVVHGPVHDLDRAMATEPAWQDALARMEGLGWGAAGLATRATRRLIRLVRTGVRPRAGVVARLRVLGVHAGLMEPGC